MNLFAFSGSPTPGSTIGQLLRAAVALAPSSLRVSVFEENLGLPLFDPALTGPGLPVPPAVAALHQCLAAADAVLFATPEYAYGVPGSFKNALDWLVAAGSLYGKPTGALGASPSAEGGARALASLLSTLEALGAAVLPAATLAVPFIRTRLGVAGGHPADPVLTEELQTVVMTLVRQLQE
ncbi:NAD(P)H-dependent oxidoreductase [Hymenobacter sp. BT730]|uniref:NAD(P)H-dependent oxidoreductase n=1 Tax=Hymenobacter sp. BT730 TaxID=3063332 RepID=UPI0026DF32E5|nr:NAD(P)H-dependent oxidoreductase [Hymenobacter sp. BT730]